MTWHDDPNKATLMRRTNEMEQENSAEPKTGCGVFILALVLVVVVFLILMSVRG